MWDRMRLRQAIGTIRRRNLPGLNLLTGLILLSAWLAIFALDFASCTRTEVLTGPFPQEYGTRLATAMLHIPVPLALIAGSGGDTTDLPTRSDLRLIVNGTPWQRPHTLHVDLREGVAGAYSHWQDRLLFSVPSGASNDSRLRLTVAYKLSPRPSAPIWLGLVSCLWGAANLRWRAAGPAGAKRLIVVIRRHALPFVNLVAAVVLLATWFGVAASECGIFSWTETLNGPFVQEHGTRVLTATLTIPPALAMVADSGGDDTNSPQRSRLRLVVNGVAWQQPHAQHTLLRQGTEGAFSHWKNDLLFVLPRGVSNDAGLHLTAIYKLRPKESLLPWFGLVTVLYGVANWRRGSRLARGVAFACTTGARGGIAAFGRHASPHVNPVIAIALLLAWAGVLVLACGSFTRTEVLTGPFLQEGVGTHLLSAQLNVPIPLSFIADSGGDDGASPTRSDLQLTVNGMAWPRPHTLHAELERGAAGAYSHWTNELLFTVPPAVSNDSRLHLTATYTLRPKKGLPTWLAVATLFYGAANLWLRSRLSRRVTTVLAASFLGASYLASWAAIACALLYAASILWGLVAGHAIPAAAIFAMVPASHRLWDAGEQLPSLLLWIAAGGVLCGWASRAEALDHALLVRGEMALTRLWSIAALPVTVLLFLFGMAGSGWSGNYGPNELNYLSIGGLIPNSDALDYYIGDFDLANFGHWDEVSSRRPLAAGLRALTLFAGGSTYIGTLIVQAILVAICLCLAVRCLSAWLGLWAAIAFFAMTYGLVRPYLLTTMTEPLGVAWACISVALFAESLRTRQTALGLAGFGAIVCALMTRMGAMFTIPGLMLWLPFAFADKAAKRLRLFAVTVAVLGLILVVNTTLAKLYAAPDSEIGGNFALVACGAAHGADYKICPGILAGSLTRASSLHERNVILYSEALHAFRADPAVLARFLGRNARDYVMSLPKVLLTNSMSLLDRLRLPRWVTTILILLPGWRCVARRRGGRPGLELFLVILLTSAVSAGIVFGNDGYRTMFVAYVLVALIFAAGFASPAGVRADTARPSPSSRLAVAGLGALLLSFPIWPGLAAWEIRRIEPPHPELASAVAQKAELIPAGALLSGFLDVPDGDPLPAGVPAIHASAVRQMMTAFDGAPPPHPSDILPRTLFAVVFARNVISDTIPRIYFGPPSLLTDRGVRYWLVTPDSKQLPPYGFARVADVEPWR